VEGKYEDWYKKNRTPFALLRDATNTLVALIWLGPEPLHEGCKCHTISWRSYNPWRGKGLMRDFTKFAMGIYKKNFPDVKYWARIVRTNEGSLNFAESLGFEISKKFSDDSSLVLTTFAQS
jgi:RimJ/RimL family protein N-acetyltransferase